MGDDGRRLIEAVEYQPNGAYVRIAVARNVAYEGVGPRKSDGMTCLRIRSGGATRSHNIEVGDVVAITLNGVRHALEAPPARYRVRAQEIVRLVEGAFSEEWAAAYFDPASPKYWKREVMEAATPATPPSRRARANPLAVVVAAAIVAAAAAVALLM